MNNREIKFRCWDALSNKMLSDIDIEERTLRMLDGDNDQEYLQFTGLKDKNGKEMYEGYIIKVTRSITGMRNEESISEIKYFDSHGCFGFTTKYGWLDFSNCQMDTLEVIGNIYENPKLLTS